MSNHINCYDLYQLFVFIINLSKPIFMKQIPFYSVGVSLNGRNVNMNDDISLIEILFNCVLVPDMYLSLFKAKYAESDVDNVIILLSTSSPSDTTFIFSLIASGTFSIVVFLSINFKTPVENSSSPNTSTIVSELIPSPKSPILNFVPCQLSS